MAMESGVSNQASGLRPETEFAARLREVQTRLYGYIHSLARDLNDADDLFQQTTLIMWKKFDEYDRGRSFFSWACGIARLEVVNFLRSRTRRRLYFSDDLTLLLIEAQDGISHDAIDDRQDALASCMAKLRQRDRELLLECYQETGGVNQAAGKRGRSPQSVFNSLRRIRRALFVCISRSLSRESKLEWIS
jgi:RNA polymerase sigma-70 factor (ECF subfamily)